MVSEKHYYSTKTSSRSKLKKIDSLPCVFILNGRLKVLMIRSSNLIKTEWSCRFLLARLFIRHPELTKIDALIEQKKISIR